MAKREDAEFNKAYIEVCHLNETVKEQAARLARQEQLLSRYSVFVAEARKQYDSECAKTDIPYKDRCCYVCPALDKLDDLKDGPDVMLLLEENLKLRALLAGWLMATGPFIVMTDEQFEDLRKKTEDVVTENA